MRNLEPAPLAALAGEDRAALSGRPRKAIAGQYAGVLPQRDPVRNSGFDNLRNVRPIRLVEGHFELPAPCQR